MTNKKIQDIQHLSSKQYASVDKLSNRWDFYNYAVPEIDIHQVGVDRLQLSGRESILDVGCGSGEVLVNLRQGGHEGKLVGLDINEEIFRESVELQEQKDIEPPIEFMVGSADNLPFSDGSFDIILAFFVIYHMPDIQKTLQEWSRVLKDGGRVLIAVSSSVNKPKHKAFRKMVKNIVGSKESPRFGSSFNLENARRQLNGVFEVVDQFVYDGRIEIDTPDPYMAVLDSVRDMYEPVPSDDEWREARDIVRKEVEREINQYGVFTDKVKRGFLICEKAR